MNILIINGPNLNLLGKRDSNLYGKDTLDELNAKLAKYATNLGANLSFYFSNCEGELITAMQQADCQAIILNAGAYSHYSYAIRDCIEAIKVPVVEVHLSNILAREEFRQKRVFQDVVVGFFCGEQINSYVKAIDFCLALKK
ncbi:MAG: type II 3-dehydroquinate dehydratase [Clostridia bacterium]